MGQTVPIMSSTTILRARTRRQQYSTSGVMFLIGRLRRSALLLTAMRFMVVSAPFSDTWLHDADFLCRVTDTWSHRYSEFLLVCGCYHWQDLIPPSSFSDCFPSEGVFAELWYLYSPRSVNATRADTRNSLLLDESHQAHHWRHSDLLAFSVWRC